MWSREKCSAAIVAWMLWVIFGIGPSAVCARADCYSGVDQEQEYFQKPRDSLIDNSIMII